jgi:hypothetical protein
MYPFLIKTVLAKEMVILLKLPREKETLEKVS